MISQRRNLMSRPSKSRAVCGLALASALALCASPSMAGEKQWAQDRGVTLGLQFLSNNMDVNDPDGDPGDDLYMEESGGGININVGYNFTRSFSLRLSLTGAAHETNRDGVEMGTSSAVFEAQWRFLPMERARPYLFGGLGGTTLFLDENEYDAEITGGVAVIGAGLLYNLTEHLVVDTNLRIDMINWEEVELTRELPGGGSVALAAPVDEDGGAAKFQLGLGWEF